MKPFKPALPLSLLPLLALLALLLLAGCATYRDSSREIALKQTLKTFENLVRWGDLSKLDSFLTPELQAAKEGPAPNYDNIRVVQYRVVQPAVMAEEGTVAMGKVRIAYVLQDRQLERSLIDEQRWVFDETLNEWRRASPLPQFK